MNTKNTLKLLGGFALLSISLNQTAIGNVVYDNTTTDSNARFNPGLLEVGDEVLLNTDFRAGNPGATITNFSFQYYGVNFSGDEQMRFRIYANDGAESPSGRLEPGSILFDSALFSIGATDRLVINISDLSINVPNRFTWSVQFTGITGGEEAGLDLYSPPSTGLNYVNYWKNTGGTWTLEEDPMGANIDFAARIEAVPEPSTLALGVLGGSLALAALKRRTAKK